MTDLAQKLKLPEDSLVLLVLGIAILLFGQRLVILLIGTAAFYITAQAAKKYFGEASRTTVLMIATLAGIGAGVFTKMFRNIAVGIAGYTIAGFVLASHAGQWGIKAENERFVFVVGGVIGSLLVSFALDFGLKVISSVLGAILIVQYFQLEQGVSRWLAILLVVAGFFVQSGLLNAFKKEKKSSPNK